MILGAIALSVKKGGTVHRRGGLLFVYAMATMGISASILGFLKSPTNSNVIGGIMPVYFVATALMTVRRASTWTRPVNIAGLAFAGGVGLVDIASGFVALQTRRLFLNGVPFPMYFFLGTVMLLAAAGDLRVLRFGAPSGPARLRRHLWRMCFALFIAAGSFFSIRERVAKILPEPFLTPLMRALPIVLIFGAMFYWMLRVRHRRAVPPLRA